MKKVYFILLLVYSTNGNTETAFEFCRQAILASKPYGVNATVEKPANIHEVEERIVINWGGSDTLIVTGKDGVGSMSLGRCVYDKVSNNIEFLSVYTDTLVSMYAHEIEQLNSSNQSVAMDFAKRIGLSELEIQWLKRNGGSDFIGYLKDEQNPIFGIENHDKKILDKLDSLQIINVYPVQNKPSEFWSISTDFSKALANEL